VTKPVAIFDFDDNAEWGARLWEVLRHYLPDDMDKIVRAVEPEFIEDAADVVLAHADKRVLCEVMTEWLRSHHIRGYHGTRVNADELASIRRDGLQPLKVHQRAERLERALSQHPRWNEVKHTLPAALELFGPGMRSGRREGQVHLTVSRSGLVNGFNHYLREGSEFDWHVSHHLLGPEGQALMAADGKPYLIALLVPGDAALASCNRHGIPTDDFPNPVSDLFRVWSYWLGYPDYRASRLKLDCGLVFSDTVPASWIDRIEKIDVI
jgi:hypothetical protein